MSNRDGNFEIYVMDADGTDQTRLTNTPGSDFAPDWQPLVEAENTPSIIPATLARERGAPALNAPIATVSDPDQAPDSLQVTATPATGSGVSVTALSVDADGTVRADVAASCSATDSTFTVEVTDAAGASATATLTVNVTDTTAPVLTVSATPIRLWPPNHKFVTVTLAQLVSAVSDCDPSRPPDGNAGKGGRRL